MALPDTSIIYSMAHNCNLWPSNYKIACTVVNNFMKQLLRTLDLTPHHNYQTTTRGLTSRSLNNRTFPSFMTTYANLGFISANAFCIIYICIEVTYWNQRNIILLLTSLDLLWFPEPKMTTNGRCLMDSDILIIQPAHIHSQYVQ